MFRFYGVSGQYYSCPIRAWMHAIAPGLVRGMVNFVTQLRAPFSNRTQVPLGSDFIIFVQCNR